MISYGCCWYALCRTGFHGASKDKSAPYEEKDIAAAFRKTTAVALKACIAVNEHVKITAYHSGHIAGGCAFYIELGSSSILYVNDFSLGGGRVLLPAQIPRLYPSTLIARSSFAVSVSETKTAMEREFMKVVYECIHSEGKVIIPVYRLGFFHELMTILLDYWKRMKFTCPIYLSNEAMEYPGRYTALLRRTYTDSFLEMLAQRDQAAPGAAPDIQTFDWKRLQQPGPFVLFTGPANISQGDSFRAIKACASDPKNLIVLSEHCTPGTVNYMLYADPQRKEISKRLGVNVSCGVHYLPCGDEADAKSIVELAARVSPQQVLLDYVVPEDLSFIKAHITSHLKNDPEIDTVSVSEISPVGPTEILPPREIALRIHKSMFNNPSDVQGMLVVEAKRKMMLVTVGNGARRLKKKRHSLQFSYAWKKAPEASVRVKKRSSRAPSSALSFLLSAAVESAEEDEPEEQPHANAQDLLRTLTETVRGWIRDVTIEQNDQWIKIRSVGVSVSSEWEVNLEWAYEDEELAGRILGIAKQVIHAEYAKALDQ